MDYESAVNKIDEYVKTGCAVGGFLSACLENDLYKAVGQADLSSLKALPDIVKYIFNSVPMRACGSKDKVHQWQEDRIKKGDFVWQN